MGTAYGVAVVYLGTITANDQDGETWRLLVNDGHNGGEIYATMSKSAIAEVGNVDAGMLCAAVEKRAGSYPRETRLADLLAEGTITLTADSFI